VIFLSLQCNIAESQEEANKRKKKEKNIIVEIFGLMNLKESVS
jgi:hypothetical protein